MYDRVLIHICQKNKQSEQLGKNKCSIKLDLSHSIRIRLHLMMRTTTHVSDENLFLLQFKFSEETIRMIFSPTKKIATD